VQVSRYYRLQETAPWVGKEGREGYFDRKKKRKQQQREAEKKRSCEDADIGVHCSRKDPVKDWKLKATTEKKSPGWEREVRVGLAYAGTPEPLDANGHEVTGGRKGKNTEERKNRQALEGAWSPLGERANN